MFVTDVDAVDRSGTFKFFGQLTRRSAIELLDVMTELEQIYEKLSKPPLLYEDVQCHLGDFGVVKYSKDSRYYRVTVKEEQANDIVVLFVDFGNLLVVPRCEVYAPVNALKQFTQPAFGIKCRIDLPECHELNDKLWTNIMKNRTVHVKIGSCNGDFHEIVFTESTSNKTVIQILEEIKKIRESPKGASSLVSPSIVIQGISFHSILTR